MNSYVATVWKNPILTVSISTCQMQLAMYSYVNIQWITYNLKDTYISTTYYVYVDTYIHTRNLSG